MKILLKLGTWGFVLLVGLGIIGAIIGSTGSSTRQTSMTPVSSAPRGFTISVTGSPRNVVFHGSLGWTEGGQYRSKSVQGQTPETYEVTDASTVSVFFQKKDEYTDVTLQVQISKNGRVIAAESTSASYGAVTIASQ